MEMEKHILEISCKVCRGNPILFNPRDYCCISCFNRENKNTKLILVLKMAAYVFIIVSISFTTMHYLFGIFAGRFFLIGAIFGNLLSYVVNWLMRKF